VIRVSGPWDAVLYNERGTIPIAWNPVAGSHLGTLPSADVEANLKKSTAIDFNSHDWSWLLNPNRPLILPSVQRVHVSCKSQLAPEPEETTREENISASDTRESTQRAVQPTVSLRKPRLPGGRLPTIRRGV